MEKNSGENSGVDGAYRDNIAHQEDDQELLKGMISDHPLFELLIQTHLNCFKVALGEFQEGNTSSSLGNEARNKLNVTTAGPDSSELDKFMEAYCMALKKLKEAMEIPLQDTTSFINNMYAQLENLSVTENNSELSNIEKECDQVSEVTYSSEPE